MRSVPSEALWNKSNRTHVLIASGAAIAAIAAADWWTEPYISLGFLYLFPIMLASGFLPRLALLLLGLVCAALSEAFSALDPTWSFSRFLFETLALAGCGLFVSELLRNRRLTVETQHEQRKNQERLHALVETSPAAIVTVDQHGIVELANRAAVELIEPPGAVLLGEPIAAFLPELQNALPMDGRTQFRTSMECHVRRTNGKHIRAEVWFSTFKEQGSSKLAAIIADVSEEQRADATNGAARHSLNDRQLSVLRLVLEGLRNTEIEARLRMTPSAVKNILHQLFSKAGARNRSQLVRVALERYRDLL
jgi:two-component system, LuxR family, sensor kinase FixL